MAADRTSFRQAKRLWSVTARELAPAEFQSRFDRLYPASRDLMTLWQLGGAANDYVRAHPHAIVVPMELATMLLAGDHVDARIIGLKLLNTLAAPVPQTIVYICAALRSTSDSEVYGGLYELGRLLDWSPQPALNEYPELQRQLQALGNSNDPYIRSRSADFLRWLEDASPS